MFSSLRKNLVQMGTLWNLDHSADLSFCCLVSACMKHMKNSDSYLHLPKQCLYQVKDEQFQINIAESWSKLEKKPKQVKTSKTVYGYKAEG